MENKEKIIDKHEIKLIDEELEEIENYYTDEEDLERDISTQEIIDALETKIDVLEDFDDGLYNDLEVELKKTLVLVCKILSVELNRTLNNEDELGKKISYIA